MASRVAAQDLMKFCDEHPDCGIWYTIAETTSQFTFANSESTKCNQKLVVCMHDREYAVQSTEFDIVEQGHVPILMSLPQMRNLSRMMWNVRFDKHKKSSFLTYFSHYEYGFHQKNTGSSSQEEAPENLVLVADDEWVINEADMELIRIHKRVRKAKFEPKDGQVPIPLEYLDNQRKTIMEFSKGKKVTKEDNWRSPELPTSPSTESWKGRTVFKILPGGVESRTSVRANLREPGRSEIGSPEDMISKGKPEDSSGKPGAAGSFPLGKEQVKRRVRAKGRGPQGPAPISSAPPPAPADDLDLQDYEPSEPKESDLDPPK
ncbi:unnamed protein product, partial [Symbiodinium necroappetens]